MAGFLFLSVLPSDQSHAQLKVKTYLYEKCSRFREGVKARGSALLVGGCMASLAQY